MKKTESILRYGNQFGKDIKIKCSVCISMNHHIKWEVDKISLVVKPTPQYIPYTTNNIDKSNTIRYIDDSLINTINQISSFDFQLLSFKLIMHCRWRADIQWNVFCLFCLNCTQSQTLDVCFFRVIEISRREWSKRWWAEAEYSTSIKREKITQKRRGKKNQNHSSFFLPIQM